MSAAPSSSFLALVDAIRAAGIGIYDPHPLTDELLIPKTLLEGLLRQELFQIDLLSGVPKTRSKILKQKIAEVLGYSVPKSFRRRDHNPAFPGQNFDTYGQQASNLQVWNQSLVVSRRYVIVSIGNDNRVLNVRVVTGDVLIELAKKQTLTHKLQATFSAPDAPTRLLVETDEAGLTHYLGNSSVVLEQANPSACPEVGQLLPIKALFERLSPIVGQKLAAPSSGKERKGGDLVHKKICEALGYKQFGETGQFPDIRHQLLEVKLQTKKTIDLGYVAPNSNETLDIGCSEFDQLKPTDMRYSIIGGRWAGNELEVTSLSLVTGQHFFHHFKQFGGRGKNSKRQILLPRDFFDTKS
ncbi:MAG: hypothetical protein Q8M07_17320 [Prosthecobacter sp.]|nr:hypothetical protein [Prosthecobacter sp.]